MIRQNKNFFAKTVLNKQPFAKATIRGKNQYSHLHGAVYFYNVHEGSLVVAEIYGLQTKTKNVDNSTGFFGFHIHEGAHCTGDEADPYKNTGSHYNPNKQPHPAHAGDLPVLLSNNGYAYSSVYTERFKPEQVVNRTVVIHMLPDDYHSQPSGDSGMKIGCGQIKLV